MRALNYFLAEAGASLWRRRRSTLLSIAIIAVGLGVLAGFLLVTTNLDRLMTAWSESAEMSVYLADDVTPQQQAEVERALTEPRLVVGKEFVSKDEALVRFKKDFPDLAPAAGALASNPLPASLEVRVRPDASPAEIDRLGRRVATLGGVADVRYDRQWMDRLAQLVTGIRFVGLLLSAVLIVAAALTVANVVRLALVARQSEVEIMQLVGAPIAYIRGPFVVEGVLQGGLGGVVALVAIRILFETARGRWVASTTDLIDPSLVAFLSVPACLLVVAGGMAVGCLGGLIASRPARGSV